MDILTCNKCNVEGTHNLFVSNTFCKKCANEYKKKYYIKNIKHIQEYRLENAELLRKKAREYNYKNGGKPMSKNRNCSSFLGVYIAERVLAHVFNEVKITTYGNNGYDFICNKGNKIDVKSSCLHNWNHHSSMWHFTIRKNKVADYFLCIAFDNRNDLTPIHVWILPGIEFNYKKSVSISTSTINKWGKYAIDIDKVIKCCNVLKKETV